jgi:hypothetical protein
LDVADPIRVAADAPASAVTLCAEFSVMYPVISSIADMPAAPTTRRARRAGCGRRRRAAGWVAGRGLRPTGFCAARSFISFVLIPAVMVDDLMGTMMRPGGKSEM